MLDKAITIVVPSKDFGDVSFQDEYSAKVFDNTYSTMYNDRCGVVNLEESSDEDWGFYRSLRGMWGITYTLKYYIDEAKAKAVVEMLRSLYDVTIIDIESED